MVVLDAVHQIQATQAPDLACRWNCKAGKCGSCSAEINGMPKLMCMTRMDDLPLENPITIEPMQAFPTIKDLVTDVSWNYEQKKTHQAVRSRRSPKPMAPGAWRKPTSIASRNFASASSASCARTCATCLRDHHKHDEFIGPRFLVHVAALEMHPLDTADRTADLKKIARHRLLQHHQVLHQGVSGTHHDHGQRDHSAQGTRGRRVLRSDQAS